MKYVRLIHWKAVEAEEKALKLQAIGYDVTYEMFSGPASIQEMRNNPPSAVVIDLTRLPSYGRDVALAIRKYKTTRYIPIVFVGGDPEKTGRIKELLPDAVYTDWSQIQDFLEQSIANPPVDPVVPRSLLEGYARAPLQKKLGIKSNAVVTLINAPDDFEKTLGELPGQVVLRKQIQGQSDLIIWFVKTKNSLERRMDAVIKALSDKGGLWIAWPKKSSGVTSELTQNDIRRFGLDSDLVDYKICSIDPTWSGLKFTRRKSN